MTIRSLLLFASVVSFLVVVTTHEAEASLPGQPCAEIGTTSLSDDRQVRLACLYDESHNTVWTDLVVHKILAAQVSKTDTSGLQPSPPRAEHWQGWYAGIDSGLVETNNSYSGLPLTSTEENLHTYGGSAGLVGGYNQVKSNGLFYGGEADINSMSNSGQTHFYQVKSSWNGYATARGRIGVAFDPALVFLTGGAALVDLNNKFSRFGGSFPPYVPYGFSSTTLHVGWTVGAGAEFALTDKISMSAQYLRLEMPESVKPVFDSADNIHSRVNFDDSANILRVGANWHFD